ncbi:MAG: glutamate formimidoyltransferase [Bdellovibrionota bacterium]|jgi:glutamate formiminotransferase/formiminotetrahydrofolate cyclodeaminase
MKLIECVANISEGSDTSVIQEVANAAKDNGALILDIDSGRSAGRSVITFAAPLELMKGAAVAFIKSATTLIDMRKHQGVHPCIGAADVCPFVSLGESTLQDCALLAEEVAKEVGNNLKIPTFLYGVTPSGATKTKLSNIRRGGYQGLLKRIKDKEITPDFGPSEVGSAGGTIIGARLPMLAYNINLANDNVEAAKVIAAKLRGSGSLKRDPAGKVIKDASGTPLREAGMFPNCEAIGWYIEDFKRAQISTNLRQIGDPPLHIIYEAAAKLAKSLDCTVTGSEIIGLIPLRALLEGEKYYKNGGVEDTDNFTAAIAGLGLRDVKSFVASEKILEYRLRAFGIF